MRKFMESWERFLTCHEYPKPDREAYCNDSLILCFVENAFEELGTRQDLVFAFENHNGQDFAVFLVESGSVDFESLMKKSYIDLKSCFKKGKVLFKTYIQSSGSICDFLFSYYKKMEAEARKQDAAREERRMETRAKLFYDLSAKADEYAKMRDEAAVQNESKEKADA